MPINFLSKGIGKGALINPADEWVCPFCEYELFYGDEAEYRRAIRNRKKILRRRRRAHMIIVVVEVGITIPLCVLWRHRAKVALLLLLMMMRRGHMLRRRGMRLLLWWWLRRGLGTGYFALVPLV